MDGIKEPPLTLAQAAEWLGRSERWVRDLVRDSKLAAKQEGRSLSFDIAELRRYWDSLPDA